VEKTAVSLEIAFEMVGRVHGPKNSVLDGVLSRKAESRIEYFPNHI